MKAAIAEHDDEALLDRVQRQTLRYFWDFAHPHSGMARERSNDAFASYKAADTVTTGGTGFGIMALLVGAERGWLGRLAVAERIGRIAAFLEAADRHHGVYPHFLHGATGRTIPFTAKDDGADLVETSFLMAGLLAARQYFAEGAPDLAARLDALWRAVAWDVHVRREDSALLWHWSPNFGWAIGLPITGWNECLITHILAASSPTHPVPPEVYHAGWTAGRDFVNGKSYDGITLPLGPEKGGPLFFAHYSFLGLDPRGLRDRYADYWQQNLAHTLVNRAHCIANPHGFAGYGEDCWGLTASDSPGGYAAHSPTDDLGVITPTAALSSFPYTPEYSMRALRHFHDDLGDRLWRDYGFVDAFAPATGWVAESHLAIDQGPIVVMIENHRSGLLWDLFMSCPEIKQGLAVLGFESPHLTSA